MMGDKKVILDKRNRSYGELIIMYYMCLKYKIKIKEIEEGMDLN
jgi:hypothetical protein